MNFITTITLGSIRFYRKTLSPDHGVIKKIFPNGGACVMYPSCSVYTEEAIIKYGLINGLFRGFRRVLRCHPYQKKLVDKP